MRSSQETDKTALNEAIAAAEALDGEDYTANSWQALQDALTAAQTVADNATASQSEINNAANALNSAVSALQIKASKAPQAAGSTSGNRQPSSCLLTTPGSIAMRKVVSVRTHRHSSLAIRI